jgi:hypothetical protein
MGKKRKAKKTREKGKAKKEQETGTVTSSPPLG